MSLDAQRRLFEACMDVAEPEREKVLQSCADAVLREEVRALLLAHDAASESLPDSIGVSSFPRIAAPHQVGLERVTDFRRLD